VSAMLVPFRMSFESRPSAFTQLVDYGMEVRCVPDAALLTSAFAFFFLITHLSCSSSTCFLRTLL